MDALDRLRDTIDRHARVPRQATAIAGLTLFRQSEPRPAVATMYRPSLCVVAGGRKQVVLGDRVFDLDDGHVLLVTVEVPVTGCVIQAAPDSPYLGLTVDVDRTRLAELVLDLPAAPEPEASAAAVAVGTLDAPLLDALARLTALLDEPGAAPVLAPLVEREILFRLLTGEHGPLLRRLAVGDGHLARIAAATDWIREHHAEPMRIEDLARRSAMSVTTFHRHFKAVTRLTPVEYRTRIRLQEARRLMLTQDLDATSIALAVGYESPSQFSREYRRRFGAAPAADAARLRRDAGGRAA